MKIILFLFNPCPKHWGIYIIISKWKNNTNKKFISYPISNAEIANEGVTKATEAFIKQKQKSHPLLARLMELHFTFLGSEYVKSVHGDNNKGYEYLYSAFYTDRILDAFEQDGSDSFDCLLYPSVASGHRFENLAVTPKSVEENLKIECLTEYMVEEVYYDDFPDNKMMPAKLKKIGFSDWVDDICIVWDE